MADSENRMTLVIVTPNGRKITAEQFAEMMPYFQGKFDEAFEKYEDAQKLNLG